MFRQLQRFLSDPHPTRTAALRALRAFFMLAFGAQLLLAVVAWGLLSLFVTPAEASSPLTGQALIAMALVEAPLALVLARRLTRRDDQVGALGAATLVGVLLATPAWFALFAWLIGAGARPLSALLALLALYAGLGVLLVGRYSVQATRVPDKRMTRRRAEQASDL